MERVSEPASWRPRCGTPTGLRKIASIPDDRRIVVAIALGHPDPDYPLNRFERKRAEPREIVHWVD